MASQYLVSPAIESGTFCTHRSEPRGLNAPKSLGFMFSVSWQWDSRGAYPETLSTGLSRNLGQLTLGATVKFWDELLLSEKQAEEV